MYYKIIAQWNIKNLKSNSNGATRQYFLRNLLRKECLSLSVIWVYGGIGSARPIFLD